MGMAAILVVWHKSYALTIIPPSHGGSTWNMASTGLAVFTENKFESDLEPRSMNDFDLWYS